MSEGLRAVLQDLVEQGRIDAVLGLGGTGGTDLLSGAFKNLGMGVPKLIVSTMASNNTRPYVGHSDMMMMNAVTDIAGLNSISKQVLGNAAHAAAGMARGRDHPGARRGEQAADRGVHVRRHHPGRDAGPQPARGRGLRGGHLPRRR